MIEELRKLLAEYPDAMKDKKRFRALLYDYFPLKRREANALYMAYEIGIPENMRQTAVVSSADIIRYERQLEYNYGLDEELILQIIELWARALEVKVDYEFLSNNGKTDERDEDIFKKYHNTDSVYEMLTMALKEKFPVIRENYSGTSKYYDDIIIDLFQFDREYAMEAWLWLMNLYWDRLDNEEEPTSTLLYNVLSKIIFDKDGKITSDLEKYPLLLKIIFRKGNDIDYLHQEILMEILRQDKMDILQRSISYLYENRKEHHLNMDEIIENIVKRIRPSGGMMLSDDAFSVLETEVHNMQSAVMKANTLKILQKKRNDAKFFSQAVPERNAGNRRWNFAALKEKAVAMRKDNPMWDGYKFINFTTVVGLYYRSDKEAIIADLHEGDRLYLKREPDNEYDSMAVAVYDSKSRQMGYLPKESNTFMATMMDAGQEFICRLFSFSKSQGNANIAIEIFLKQ